MPGCPTNLDNSRARAYCACSRCGWGLFGHFFLSSITSLFFSLSAGPRSAVGRAPDSYVRGPGFDTQSGHILSFLLPLIQKGQLSVTGESMCTKYWLTA